MPAEKTGWVVVLGAGGALGGAIVRHFVAQGRRVLAIDKDEQMLAGFDADGLRKTVVDLISIEAAESVLASINDGDVIALLVNAAGLIWNEPIITLRGAKFSTHALDSWHRVIEANLTAPFLLSTVVARRMARRGS